MTKDRVGVGEDGVADQDRRMKLQCVAAVGEERRTRWMTRGR